MPRKRPASDADDRIRAVHMRDAAREAIFFAKGRTRRDLETDRMFMRAVVSCIQEIGEAAARMSDGGRARIPDLPWGQIVGMRHILVHVYDRIDLDAVWNVLTIDFAAVDRKDRCGARSLARC